MINSIGEYDASLIGREFVHFKGRRYRLLGFARFSESEELMVVYQTLYGESGMWVRPAKMFFENVTRDGVTQPRFRLLCGGFTTFSTFSKEALSLAAAGRWGACSLYVVGSVVLGLAVAALAFLSTRG